MRQNLQKVNVFTVQKRLKLETVELDTETLERIDQAVASVEDPDLKAHFKATFYQTEPTRFN